MSIRVMSAVWGLDLPDSEMLVLLALADWSNDDGVCWPSIAQLVKKTRKSERTIQGTIKALVSKGHMNREEKPGQGCIYTIHPRSDCTPAETAPPQGTTDTPAAAAPNTSVNINTSQKASPSSRRARAKPKPFRLPDDWKPTRFADDTVAREVIDRRGQEWARAQLEAFRNWAANADDKPGKGRKTDWQAAFGNWVMREDKNGPARQHAPSRAGNSASGMGRTVDAAQRFLARRAACLG